MKKTKNKYGHGTFKDLKHSIKNYCGKRKCSVLRKSISVKRRLRLCKSAKAAAFNYKKIYIYIKHENTCNYIVDEKGRTWSCTACGWRHKG